MKALRRIVSCVALALAAPLSASLPTLEPAPAPAPAATAPAALPTPIADTSEAGSDARIARRLTGIFGELPAFSEVEVSVSEGVVSLTGTVPAQEDIARAEGIAARVFGVVTVENGLERDVSIGAANPVRNLADRVTGLVRILPLLGLALALWLAIAFVGYLIAGLSGLWRRIAPNPFLSELIASALRFIFVVGGLVVALDTLGATALLGAVLGGAGVIGIALGFAMRDTIGNYLASLMLSLRQPFRANDHVVIDAHEGRVVRLTSRATVLMTLDGNHLRIPNSAVYKAVILNYSRNPTRRFEFDLALDPGADALAARDLGREALAGLDFVLRDPAPTAQIVAVGEPSGTARFQGWIDQRESDWGKARSLAIVSVKRALDSRKLALPAPVYRVRLNRGDGAPDEAGPAKKTRARPASAKDIEPADEIKSMVAAERASSPAEGGDLLDDRRPVE